MPLQLAVRDIALFERPVRFARPFRFGAVVVEAASQVFVRAEVEIEGKGRAVGASAEMMVPKWFDKRASLSPEQTVDELRRSLAFIGASGALLAIGCWLLAKRGPVGRMASSESQRAARRCVGDAVMKLSAPISLSLRNSSLRSSGTRSTKSWMLAKGVCARAARIARAGCSRNPLT